MFSIPAGDTKPLGKGKMCLYLLLTALQLSCCQGAAVDPSLRDAGEVKRIAPKQIFSETRCEETNQTVVCACGPDFGGEIQKLKMSRIPKPYRNSYTRPQCLLSYRK
jgi:hypothetical protein